MSPDIFQPDAPGRLVPTSLYEAYLRDGRPDRREVAGLAFVPADLPPPGLDPVLFTGRLAEDLLRAERALARLAGALASTAAAGVIRPLLERPFRHREAKFSSQIENTIASVEEVALAEAGAEEVRSDAQEVANYLRALEHGLASPLPLSTRLFNEMHAILMEGVRGGDKRPGRLRDVQNYIGSGGAMRERGGMGGRGGFAAARFVPPPPGEVGRCMGALEAFLNPDGVLPPRERRFPVLVELAMAHYQFEAIHPYADGNGRLGRLMIALGLARGPGAGGPTLYVSAYIDRHREHYYDLLLRVSTHGDWESWTRFMLDAVATEAADAERRASRLILLREEYMSRVGGLRRTSRAGELVEHLFAHPVVSAASVAAALGLSREGANQLVRRFMDAGVLRQIGGRGYRRHFAAADILRAIEEDAPPAKGAV